LAVSERVSNTLAISASIFGNPAVPASQFDDPAAGSLLVAIEFSMTDRGPGGISNDADVGATLVGSNGQAYTLAFDNVQGCTNFADGQFTLTRGESENGCVAFAVPNGVGLRRVTFSLTDGSVDTVQWMA
jgi:hypothetical protein